MGRSEENYLNTMKYQPIIGLEIHVQLKTKSKMFCTCDNVSEGIEPNINVCPVCMGHPGVLPVANTQAIDWAVLSALALGCKIPSFSKFDRKNYFYPDLPKGYQISQYDKPIGVGGQLILEYLNKDKVVQRKVRIKRAHLEEDAAKLVHDPKTKSSLVDFNRAGTPLLEIVTEPDIRSAKEAKVFMQELRDIFRYLDVSSCDMEKGQLRCDANISLKPEGSEILSAKTEIKNLNSFKAVERALEHEVERQTALWKEKKAPKESSTRGWDDGKQLTYEMRTKEEVSDYRYFPEPDLPPLEFTEDCIKEIKLKLPELPHQKRERLIKQYELGFSEAKMIASDRLIGEFYEGVLSELREWLSSLGEKEEKIEVNIKELRRLVASWIVRDLFKHLSEKKINMEQCKITPENFAEFITYIYKGEISGPAARTVFEEMFRKGADPSHIIDEKNLRQVSDKGELDKIIEKVIKDNSKPVEDYKKGKSQALQFLVGQVMRETKGKANPKIVGKILKEKLK